MAIRTADAGTNLTKISMCTRDGHNSRDTVVRARHMLVENGIWCSRCLLLLPFAIGLDMPQVTTFRPRLALAPSLMHMLACHQALGPVSGFPRLSSGGLCKRLTRGAKTDAFLLLTRLGPPLQATLPCWPA